MAVVGGHNADHLKAIFPPGLLLGHLLPRAITALLGDAQRGSKVPAAPGIRGKNAGHQCIAVVKPGRITMGLTDIRSRPTADNAEAYLSLWSIHCFSHNIILEISRPGQGCRGAIMKFR